MKKIINKVTYNTDTSNELGAINSGEFGDSAGYEERLYQTKKEECFLYGVGGSESKYPEPSITVITAKEAKEWLNENKANLVKV